MIDFQALANEVIVSLDTGLQEWVHNQLFNNEFLVAGIATVTLTGLAFLLRNVPLRIWNAAKERFSFEVTVNNDNELFVSFTESLSRNSINFLSRRRVLNGRKLTIGYGGSVSFFQGWLCFVNRETIESQSKEPKEKTTVVFPFLTKRKAEKMFQSFVETSTKDEDDMTKIYKMSEAYMEKIMAVPKRKKNSIFVNAGTLDELEHQIDLFLAGREWYLERGIPYKFGIMLEGPPGTGKTSLAKYIANYTNRNLVIATPGDLKYIAQAINSDRRVWDDVDQEYKGSQEKYVVLLEDIDCFDVVADREAEDHDNSKPTIESNNLSTVLNVLDGIYSPEDVIIVATTNHLEKLDHALLRKGRFDKLIHIGLLEDAEIKRMLVSFCGNHDFGKTKFAPISGADLQGLILSSDQKLDVILPQLNIL